MSKHNKAREIWLDRYRTALVQACGAAAILGFTDHAATLCEMIDAARAERENEEEKRMNIYEVAITWRAGEGLQKAYAYCVAENKNAAKKKISEKIPYCIRKIEPEDFGTIQDADRNPMKASEIGSGVTVWYFDEYGKEHHEKF